MGEDGSAARSLQAHDSMLARVAQDYRLALNAYFRRRVPLAHECEDLTQEVLLRLAGRGDDGSIRHVQPYVFQTAASVLVDHFRRRSRHGADVTDPYEHDDLPAVEASPEQALMGSQSLARLRQEIADLPDRARQAFILFRFEGMKQAEIASLMGISVSTVEKHIKLGMIRLASAMAGGE